MTVEVKEYKIEHVHPNKVVFVQKEGRSVGITVHCNGYDVEYEVVPVLTASDCRATATVRLNNVTPPDSIPF